MNASNQILTPRNIDSKEISIDKDGMYIYIFVYIGNICISCIL